MNKVEVNKKIMELVKKNNSETYKWTHFVVKNVAMFYPNIAQPKDWQDTTPPKYGITIVIPNTDKVAITDIETSYSQVAKKFQLNLLDYKYPNKFKDGDGYNADREMVGKKINQLYTGRYFLQMNTKFPIPLVNLAGAKITPDENFDRENNGRIINLKYGLKPYFNTTTTQFGIVCIPIAIQLLENGKADFAPTSSSQFEGFEFTNAFNNNEDGLPFM